MQVINIPFNSFKKAFHKDIIVQRKHGYTKWKFTYFLR